jgi:hypothetical protein
MVAITSLSPTSPKPGDNTTVNLSGAANALGKTLELDGVNLTLLSQDINSITLTWPALHELSTTPFLQYDQGYPLEVNDNGDVNTEENVVTQPPNGFTFVAITALTGILADDTGLEIGDELLGEFIIGAGTVNSAGIESVTQFPATFRYWVFDVSANQWVGPADASFTGTVNQYPTSPPYAPVIKPVGGQTNQGNEGIAQQVNPIKAREFDLVYTYLDDTDFDSIMDDYEANKLVTRELVFEGDTYTVSHKASPKVERQPGSPIQKKVTITLHAVKQ